jgi:hypothetical protein
MEEAVQYILYEVKKRLLVAHKEGKSGWLHCAVLQIYSSMVTTKNKAKRKLFCTV